MNFLQKRLIRGSLLGGRPKVTDRRILSISCRLLSHSITSAFHSTFKVFLPPQFLIFPLSLYHFNCDMLNGLYGFIFGNMAAVDSAQKIISQENVAVLTDQLALVANNSANNAAKIEDDWIFVEDRASGRSSPVFVANLEIEDLDSVSTISTDSTTNSTPPSPAQIRHSEALQHAKMIVAQRSRLEQKLFGDPNLLRPSNKYGDTRTKSVTSQLTASKLKRSTAAGHVASESKIKQRSKKGGKLLAGRNNDRKVNNLN
uniref:Uncharacterized protein n=1 Tax=Parascaris univalens TaxID=6257 RepID=A0A914ZUW3_PARUN